MYIIIIIIIITRGQEQLRLRVRAKGYNIIILSHRKAYIPINTKIMLLLLCILHDVSFSSIRRFAINLTYNNIIPCTYLHLIGILVHGYIPTYI